MAVALLWAWTVPAGAGQHVTCSGYVHEPLDGFPTHVDWGASLPDLQPSARIDATFSGNGFVQNHRQRLGADRAVLFSNGVSIFATYGWTISAGDEEIASGAVEVGPEEEPGCTIASLRAEARRALRERASPSASPSPSPARPAEQGPQGGGFPWSWLIGIGGALAVAGGFLLRRGTGSTEPTLAPAARTAEGFGVDLRAEPPGRLEKPVEEGERVELTATVRNDGTQPVPGLRLRILRDGDDDRPLLDRSWKRPLAPGATVSASEKLDTPRGRTLGPGLTTTSLTAIAEGDGRRATSEEVTLHVGHPVLVISLASAPTGRVAEGTEVVFTVDVGNVGRGTAKDLEGTLEVGCEGRRSRDSWERTFEVEELKAGKAHEEEFRISPSALGESRGARLTARARVASGEERAESDEVTGTVTPA